MTQNFHNMTSPQNEPHKIHDYHFLLKNTNIYIYIYIILKYNENCISSYPK